MGSLEALRVGVVGCGGQGVALAKGVVRSDRLRLVACADPDVAATRRVAALADDVGRYASLGELLGDADVDAVLIATTHDLLAPLALSAIRAGRHVFVEKPMALDESQAREVEFAAASAGVTCMVGYSFRYGMGRYVFDLIGQGAVGQVRSISGAIGMPALEPEWFAMPEHGGGALLFVGCHLIDLAMWLAGDDPTAVWASVHERPGTGLDDTSMIQLEFSGDRVAQLLVAQSPAGFFYETRVVGTLGSIALRGRDFLQFDIEVDSAVPTWREPTIIRPGIRGDHINSMLMPELAEFADAVQQGRTPAISASDGRRVLRVLDAARESSRTRQPITLPPILAAY